MARLLDFWLRGRYMLSMSLALVALLICCSCTQVPHSPAADTTESVPEPTSPATVTIHGDVDFTPAEREKLLLAAEVWHVQTDKCAQISIIWDADLTDTEWVKAHKDDNLLGRFTSEAEFVRESDDESGAKLLGRVSPSGGIHNPWRKPVRMVLIADRLDARDSWIATAVHEFGHVLGVPHVQAVQGVMFPYYIAHRHQCLKKPDLVAFCQVNECGSKKMHPCE